jgi:hypothetical protein
MFPMVENGLNKLPFNVQNFKTTLDAMFLTKTCML